MTEERMTPALEACPFQDGVAAWMAACFGAEISGDLLERADRFTEEALELAQTMPGFSAERAHALVDYVFGRPVGEREQEVGGVMVTLAALCNPTDIDIGAAAAKELARVWTKVEAIRAKQAAKPTGSALPIASPAPEPVAAMEPVAWQVTYNDGVRGGRAIVLTEPDPKHWDSVTPLYAHPDTRAHTEGHTEGYEAAVRDVLQSLALGLLANGETAHPDWLEGFEAARAQIIREFKP